MTHYLRSGHSKRWKTTNLTVCFRPKADIRNPDNPSICASIQRLPNHGQKLFVEGHYVAGHASVALSPCGKEKLISEVRESLSSFSSGRLGTFAQTSRIFVAVKCQGEGINGLFIVGIWKVFEPQVRI